MTSPVDHRVGIYDCPPWYRRPRTWLCAAAAIVAAAVGGFVFR